MFLLHAIFLGLWNTVATWCMGWVVLVGRVLGEGRVGHVMGESRVGHVVGEGRVGHVFPELSETSRVQNNAYE